MNISIDLIIRILVGGFLGGAIGFERELRSKGAGFRTHFLVSLSSALLTVISAYGFQAVMQAFPDSRYDLSRITAQIVSGIGFIGAGIIIFQKNTVHGLTTAAGLWSTSAIGIACGVGFYDLAVISTVLVLIVLEATYFINLTIGRRQMTLSVTAPDKKTLEGLIDTLKADGVKIQSCEIESRSGEGGRKYIATFDISVRNEGYEDKILELTEGLDGSLVFNMK